MSEFTPDADCSNPPAAINYTFTIRSGVDYLIGGSAGTSQTVNATVDSRAANATSTAQFNFVVKIR